MVTSVTFDMGVRTAEKRRQSYTDILKHMISYSDMCSSRPDDIFRQLIRRMLPEVTSNRTLRSMEAAA
jgi:ribosomal protein L13